MRANSPNQRCPAHSMVRLTGVLCAVGDGELIIGQEGHCFFIGGCESNDRANFS